MLSEVITFTIALHHAAAGGGFDGGWIGPVVIIVLIVAGLAWASRSKGR